MDIDSGRSIALELENDTAEVGAGSGLCDAEFEQRDFDQIPVGHPVEVFARSYFPMMNGFLLPELSDVVSLSAVQRIGSWVQILEPVRRGRRLDFRAFDLGSLGKDSMKGTEPCWLGERFESDFALPRTQEAVVASVLREPLFSRGTVPSRNRFFIREYRGVFPLFTNNRPRLALAVVAAETFISVKS